MIIARASITSRLRDIENDYVLSNRDFVTLRQARRLLSDLADFYQRNPCPDQIARMLNEAGMRTNTDE